MPNNNPTGRGGFQDHPELINKEGANAKDRSWRGAVSRLTNMTRDELIVYVGGKSRMGKLLKELPPNIPVKDALVLISIVQFGRDPSPGMFNALADREDGKPVTPVKHEGEIGLSWKEFINANPEDSGE